ncbi:hypothetical protein MMC07_003480 [Pseudocyphellaria aurata]|nr:hypothetical protein [Pseudocyphellaria aurata]
MLRFESAPKVEDFTDIAEHLSRTPESFYSARPILYYSCFSATLVISRADLCCVPLLLTYTSETSTPHPTVRPSADDDDDDGGSTPPPVPDVTIPGIDIWVTSEDLKIYFPTHRSGITIPYPAISLHAIQPSTSPARPSSVYLQILKELGSYDDHDPDSTISITLIPANPTPEHHSPIAESESSSNEAPVSSTDRLFAALTDCANLHPDPTSEPGSDAGGPAIAYYGNGHSESATNEYSSTLALPPPVPGSGGWITAENVGDFYDDDGNPREQEDMGNHMTRIAPFESVERPLGDGAGRVRARDDNGDVTDEETHVNGHVNGDDTKWRRTE